MIRKLGAVSSSMIAIHLPCIPQWLQYICHATVHTIPQYIYHATDGMNIVALLRNGQLMYFQCCPPKKKIPCFAFKGVHNGSTNFSIVPAVFSWGVTSTHAYLNARWFSTHGTHLNMKWLKSPFFICGVLMYYSGLYMVVW